MPEHSEVQKVVDSSSRCPRCRRYLVYTTTYEPNGRVRRILNPTHPAALAECPYCHERWFFFTQPVDVEIVETGRTYEMAKTDKMVLDNRRGRSPLVRKYTISEEWSQEYEIEREHSDTESVKASHR
jgi:hypothetical protein